MNDTLTVAERIGGFVSTILLGKTKEIIIRTDERVLGLLKTTDEIKKEVSDLQKTVHQLQVSVASLELRLK